MIETNVREAPRESAGRADTKQRILDAAERRFAKHGVAGTSLRSVIAEAGVNLAAVHYHYGSKEALLKAVVARRIDPVNRERMAMLAEYERSGSNGALVEEIVHAFVQPATALWHLKEHAVVTRLMGRLLGEPGFMSEIAPAQFREVLEGFSRALSKALPDLSAEEVFWRMMFAVGTLTHTLRIGSYAPAISGGICGEVDADEAMRRVEVFLVAGFRVPMAGGGQ